ncbi:MAG: UPF0182 family protein [Cyanobacteria bacterium P01_F01_bin.150]
MNQLSIKQRLGLGLLAIIVLTVLFFGTAIHLLTEWWWFQAVDFVGVFQTRLTWQIVLWLGAFSIYGGFLWLNYAIASRVTRYHHYILLNELDLRAYIPYVPTLLLTSILVLSINGAAIGAISWDTILQFFNRTSFQLADPIYQRDVEFYVFQLPLYEKLHGWLLGLVVWSFLLTLGLYLIKGAIEPDRGWKYALRGGAKTHLSLLVVALALLIAAGFWLQRYELLYSSEGVVFGAGYTDVHAQEQAYWFMSIATVVLAVLFVSSLWRIDLAVPLYGVGVYFVALILLTGVYPKFQQQFVVEPNELAKETPYIEHNLEFTRQAYGLQDVERQRYPAETQLDRSALDQNAATVRNIRLWDYRPLLSTYRQLQEIRLYYRFKDVDIDRYTLDNSYRQVMLAARELDYSRVSADAQNWVNQRLKYTHGYGLAMSPVNVATPQGLPNFFIKDIPPVSSVDLDVTQPSIYYGEETDDYIFTGMTTEEFDYPKSDGNALVMYDGRGGVPIPSFLHRLAYAYDLGSLKILISNYFSPQSKIHYYRQIRQRVNHIAPFLELDNDPYITVIDGQLKWIVDAYTMSDRFPYSQPLAWRSTVRQNRSENASTTRSFNYIRNSVKVVVDAYDGTMEFFAVDNADPVLKAYQKIFPSLFTASDALPSDVKAHFRYPLDLFQAQAKIFRAYHMTDPEVFYNKEDLWNIPTEQVEDNTQLMEPYHVIMQLPGDEQEEFILIQPFTPNKKDNMIAWMAARSDGDRYGEMVLYEFPKQELVYGPSQITARINQNPNISPQLSLWGQRGSKVIHGDLLVIPIEKSLLYVEPIYLRAETGELPELKRVIVAYGDEVVMEETLDKALLNIFGPATQQASNSSSQEEQTVVLSDTPSDAPSGNDTSATEAISTELERPDVSNPEFSSLAKSLADTYEQAQEALRQGDWDTYGQKQSELQQLIQQLNQQAGN